MPDPSPMPVLRRREALHTVLLLPLALCAGVPVVRAQTSHDHSGHGSHGSHGKTARREQKPWGMAGNPKLVRRVVEVSMGDDMRFSPARLEVKQGETVKIVVRNRGKQMHEFVLGTAEELKAHAALMAKHPGMEHDEPWMAHVRPGRTGEIVWHFNRAGTFEFACLIAGHFSAGMKGDIVVSAS